MNRQNKDGRPIYSDKIWSQIQENGAILQKLGYTESINKPNLFYKQLTFNQDQNGLIFVDLRGTDFIPIWEDPDPIVYKNDALAFIDFFKEVVNLKGSGVPIRFSFFDSCEPEGWGFLINKIPSGFCKRCGKNIINVVDWTILEGGAYNPKVQGNVIDVKIEINHCKICKKMEYAKREYRNNCLKRADKCEICGEKNAELTHHITYKTAKTIRLCRSCHGVLHKKEFPNPIWKEKRKVQVKKNNNKEVTKVKSLEKPKKPGLGNFVY